MKWYISLTGPTTVGKTTLMNTLMSSSSLITPVPQSTTREIRKDDNSQLIKHFNEETYRNIDFFLCHGRYGIAQKDFQAFMQSSIPVGISTNGANEIQQIPLKGNGFSRLSILLRYSNCIEQEMFMIEQQSKLAFSKQQAQARIDANFILLRDFFYNPSFLKKYIDLVITRETNVLDWVSKIEEALGRKIVECAEVLESAHTQSLQLMTSQRS